MKAEGYEWGEDYRAAGREAMSLSVLKLVRQAWLVEYAMLRS